MLRFRGVGVLKLWEKRLKPAGQTAVAIPAALLAETGLGMLNLGLIFYMREVFRLAPGQVGWLAATWETCYVCGCLTMRPIFERLRPRSALILAMTGMSGSVLAILVSRTVFLCYILYGFFGFSLSFFWAPLMSWVSSASEGRELGRAISRLTLASSAGIIASPFLAGLLSSLAPAYPLYAALLVFSSILTLLVGSSLIPEQKEMARPHEGGAAGESQENKSTPLRYPAWVGLFCTYVCLAVVLNIFPMHARDVLGLSKKTIGTLLLMRALFTGFGYVLLGRLNFWHFNPLPMSASLGLLALLLLALPVARTPLCLGLILACLGPLVAFGFSSGFFHGASGSAHRASRLATHEALLALGMITGSAAGGQLYQRFSLGAVSLFCLGVLCTGIWLQLLLGLRRRQSRPL